MDYLLGEFFTHGSATASRKGELREVHSLLTRDERFHIILTQSSKVQLADGITKELRPITAGGRCRSLKHVMEDAKSFGRKVEMDDALVEEAVFVAVLRWIKQDPELWGFLFSGSKT